MSKFTVKTTVNNIIYDPKADSFSYTEELVSMKWTESKERAKYTQSGTGPGEFGPDYSDRKKYQLGYGNESPSPALKNYLNTADRNPRSSSYEPHVIEPLDLDKPIKRSRKTPLTKEEIELRHEHLKQRFMDPDFGPDQLKDIKEN